ncbi:urease accessory protein UreE [Halopiger aswanensis]|uniref:Urease accessory protein n=1 Tax=Halopiger aswanensis TaxID=148449 RepID=A0A419W1Q3_9EURY|nr:urease accessory protein UreE [Halopiger aswanensis]RKD89344.1 urease accessory protein [Halopiger aswanensis]
MEHSDGIVGNVHADTDLATLRDEHAANGTLERVVIDADNRRRSRFRAVTDAGTDVGVVVDKPAVSAGDVLLLEDDRMIIVAFEPRDALAVELPEATATTRDAAVELGHRIGNQHWDLAVEDGVVYVPLEADQHIVERVIADVVPGAAVRKTTVEADLFVTDLGGMPDHEHDHSTNGHEHDHGEHSHGPEDPDRGHNHRHTRDGTTHEHDHTHGEHEPDHSHDH